MSGGRGELRRGWAAGLVTSAAQGGATVQDKSTWSDMVFFLRLYIPPTLTSLLIFTLGSILL